MNSYRSHWSTKIVFLSQRRNRPCIQNWTIDDSHVGFVSSCQSPDLRKGPTLGCAAVVLVCVDYLYVVVVVLRSLDWFSGVVDVLESPGWSISAFWPPAIVLCPPWLLSCRGSPYCCGRRHRHHHHHRHLRPSQHGWLHVATKGQAGFDSFSNLVSPRPLSRSLHPPVRYRPF